MSSLGGEKGHLRKSNGGFPGSLPPPVKLGDGVGGGDGEGGGVAGDGLSLAGARFV